MRKKSNDYVFYLQDNTPIIIKTEAVNQTKDRFENYQKSLNDDHQEKDDSE